jgi:hypothetical protein
MPIEIKECDGNIGTITENREKPTDIVDSAYYMLDF